MYPLIFICLLFIPFILHASFIESTMGTAVVDDATATFHNPAALTLLKNSQAILLGSATSFNNTFTGQSVQLPSGFSQSGHSKTKANFYLPSIYVAVPIKDTIRIGFAVLSDQLNTGADETSILRYAQPNNRIDNIDFTPAFGMKLNEYLSIGAALTYACANYTSNPITGFPSLNIPDRISHNVTSSDGYGGNAGFLIKPSPSTLIGFNYRSAVTYQFKGTSSVKAPFEITSNHYNFNFWTPARGVLTISHFMTPDFGLIGTAQRVQWSIFQNVVAHGIATQVGSQSIILPEVVIPFHFHDTWIATLGIIKHVTPSWVVRVAGTYDQSSGDEHYQIINGDRRILGVSMGYEIYKNVTIDGSFAHVFVKNENININSKGNMIVGINQAVGDSVSIKLTVNV